MKRLTDTEIWEEDWFIDLTVDHKLFFLYIKDKCDHAGFWRPNRRKFQMITHGKMIMLDDFIIQVNKDDGGTKIKNRVVVLESGKWLITKYIVFQCGKLFKPEIGAHRGALKLLVTNNIHPSTIPDIDWAGFQNYDMQQLREIVHGKTLYRVLNPIHTEIEKEIDPEREIEKGKGGLGEKPKFKMQWVYDKVWSQVNTNEREFKGTTEEKFNFWKKFVDWIVKQGYEDVFTAIFVSPSDFSILVEKYQFTEEKWEPVMKKMLSTGMKPEQNLYFRIPDFIKHCGFTVKPVNSGMNTGVSGASYENMEKW